MSDLKKNIAVSIEEDNYPNVLVDGQKYNLLCEFETVNKTFTHVYVEENGANVVVQLSPQSAVVGLFSVEVGRIDDLFRFIEAFIASKDGFVCYDSEALPKYLNMLTNAVLKYPIIMNEINDKRSTLKSLIGTINRKFNSLDAVFKKLILEHTVQFNRSECSRNVSIEAQDGGLIPDVMPSKSLSKGWEWFAYSDGSGNLRAPDGICYFAYDANTAFAGSGGIEYKKTERSDWRVFYGSISEFKDFAESVILKEVEQKSNNDKAPLRFYISRAASQNICTDSILIKNTQKDNIER